MAQKKEAEAEMAGPMPELAGPAMQEPSLDSFLAKHPVTELTDADLQMMITREREARAAWVAKQEKRGKEE